MKKLTYIYSKFLISNTQSFSRKLIFLFLYFVRVSKMHF